MSTEIEIKILLSELEYIDLISKCTTIGARHLLNMYYDLNNILYSKKCMFRIRSYSTGPFKATLKIPVIIDNGCWTNTEIEEDIEDNLLARTIHTQDLPEKFRGYLYNLNIHQLEQLGYTSVYRTIAHTPHNIPIEIDKVVLPNNDVFYEVEIENSSRKLRNTAESWLLGLVPNAKYSEKSKYMRFMESL